METIKKRLIKLYCHFFVFNFFYPSFNLILAHLHNLKSMLKREKKNESLGPIISLAIIHHRVIMFLINYWQLKF
jgi:hypothetical protein